MGETPKKTDGAIPSRIKLDLPNQRLQQFVSLLVACTTIILLAWLLTGGLNHHHTTTCQYLDADHSAWRCK